MDPLLKKILDPPLVIAAGNTVLVLLVVLHVS